MSLRLTLLNSALRWFIRPKLARIKTPQDARRHFERSTGFLPVSLRGINLHHEAIPGPAGPIPVEWISAGRAQRRHIMIYLHGGAYIMGSPKTHRRITIALARLSGMRVLVPDFRLAPENPVPAGVEDALAVYSWVLAQGYDADQIAFVGESSGGGQCFATLIAALTRGFPPPACIVAFSPWVDLTMSGKSVTTNAQREVMLPVERATEVTGYYLSGSDPKNPIASPLFDTHQNPPTLIQASKSEILLDDAVRMAERLAQSGGPVTLNLWDKTPHAWQFFGTALPEARDALEQAVDFIKAHVTP